MPVKKIYINKKKIEGWMSGDCMDYLYQTVAKLVPFKGEEDLVIGEIGSWKGKSSTAILEAVADKQSKFFHTIMFQDTWDINGPNKYAPEAEKAFSEFRKNIRNYYNHNNSNILINRAQSWDSSTVAKGSTFNFLFIDADHSYESVKKDLEAWHSFLKTGSILCGHDFSNAHKGVKLAVIEFAMKHNQQFKLIPKTCIWEITWKGKEI